jgi:hypothetical protein
MQTRQRCAAWQDGLSDCNPGGRILHLDTIPALKITNIPGRLSHIKEPE